MRDVMVDLETVGNRPGCGILSIGAVAFDPKTGELGEEMYEVVRLSTCEKAGLTTQKSTMDWWKSQSKEARKVLEQASKATGNLTLEEALEKLTAFLTPFGLRNVRVWGNGGDFDNAILSAAYGALDKDCPWDFWNNRCYRTLKNLAPHVKMLKDGVQHNALADAKQQAKHAISIFATLKNKENWHAGLAK